MQQMQMLSSKLDKLQGSGDTNNAAPVYGPNIPATSSYGQQANGYGQQASGYGQQANAYGQQTAGYGQQAGGYGQQTSGYGQSNGSSGGYGSMSNMMAAAQNWSGTGATSTTETHTSWNNPKVHSLVFPNSLPLRYSVRYFKILPNLSFSHFDFHTHYSFI